MGNGSGKMAIKNPYLIIYEKKRISQETIIDRIEECSPRLIRHTIRMENNR